MEFAMPTVRTKVSREITNEEIIRINPSSYFTSRNWNDRIGEWPNT
jgi:hypothetical protein